MARWMLLGLLLGAAACGDTGSGDPAGKSPRNAAAGLPADPQVGLALYPGSRIISSTAATGAAAEGGVFQMDTTGAAGDVAAFYRSAAEEAGWTVKTDVNAGAIRIVGAVKGDENVTVEITGKTTGAGSRVVVVRGAKRPGGPAAVPVIPVAAPGK